MPQVGGNTCLTGCGIYISYSLKTSSQGHNLELKQPHKYINLGTKRMAKLKIHQLYPTTSVPQGHEVCHLHRYPGYSNTLPQSSALKKSH